jgi:hypothetical protein
VDETGCPLIIMGINGGYCITMADVPYMRGILGQYVFVIPDENMIVVRLAINAVMASGTSPG